MKKSLKIITIILAVAMVGFLVMSVFIIKSLPSAWEIKQAVVSKKLEISSGSKDENIEDRKALGYQVLRNDFMNSEVPLSKVCAALPEVGQSRLLRKDGSASATEFIKTLSVVNQKDPLAEAVAPLFRYIARIEPVQSAFRLVESSDAENSQGIFKKAELYTKLGLAAQALNSSKAKVDHLLMQSYHLFILAKAVSIRPELAKDPMTLGFCEQLEKNLISDSDVNSESAAAEMQKFLEETKVDPQGVDFDPSYRSDVSFKLTQDFSQGHQTWIEKLFTKDIAKARFQLKTETTEAPESSDY